MGSTLDTAMASDLAAALEVTGQDLVHADFDGNETTVTGQFHEEGDPARQASGDGRAVARRATVLLAQADLADPRPGHLVTVGGEGWSIETRQPVGGLVLQSCDG